MRLVLQEADDQHMIKMMVREYDVKALNRHIAMYEDNVKNLVKPSYVEHAKRMLRLSKTALEIVKENAGS